MNMHEQAAVYARAALREGRTFEDAVCLVRLALLHEALIDSRSNITNAARRLGVHRNSVMRWRREYR